MKPRIHFITLGVKDLNKSLSFYRDGLGLQTDGIVGTEFEGGEVVIFQLHGGLRLALFPAQELAKDIDVPKSKVGVASMSVGHIVDEKSEVDRLLQLAEKAGASIPASASEKPWGGYSGYFQDPDGHLWEVTWSPEPANEASEISESTESSDNKPDTRVGATPSG